MNRYWRRQPGQHKSISLLTVLCLFLFSVSGCVSTKVVSEASLDSDTSVSLSVYLEEKDRRRDRPTVDGVITELYYLENGQRQLLRREVSGNWRMGGLVPGDYAADVRCLVTDDGQWEDLSGDTTDTFTLREGENARVGIVLEKTPVALMVVAGLAAVVLAVLLIEAIDDSDVAFGALFVPPVPEALVAVASPPEMVWYGTEAVLAATGDYSVPASADEPPPCNTSSLVLVDHQPRHLSTGVTLGQDVRFRLNSAIDPVSLDPCDLLLVDRSGHPVTGGVYCLDDSRTCVFDPLRPLEPGQTYTVTLRGEGLMTLDGGKLAEDYWWYFTTVLPEGSPPAS